jgi:outer membrane protein assembly factor BamD
MLRRIHLIAVLGALLALTAACTNKKSVNPLAGVGSKQPDKVLFDKAMEAMRHNRFDVARLTLQTLINTYPDSEYIARAKLAVGDSWYAEGGTAALAQAEQEYSDFEIFFPNLKEAAEAQLKIANIHYQQMEKSDRDYTHAKRAEDEYRKVILQYPDSKLVPDAKKRLLQVQEVLADREFGIGRFYYLRESYAASIARLRSLVEKYPLYSRADEALYLLGQNYEGQIDRLRKSTTCDVRNLPRGCMREADKARAIGELSKAAAKEYSTILTRYPLMDRSDDAKKRLETLHEPVPRPTKAAVAQNKAEIESRGQATMMQRAMGLIKKGPDVSQAVTVGEPPLVDPEPVSAVSVQKDEAKAFVEAAGGGGGNKVGVEIVRPDQPSGDNVPPAGNAVNPNAPFGAPPAATPPAPAIPDPNELKPTAPSDPNELKPADSGADASLPPPTQVNEIQNQSSSSSASKADDATPASDQDLSSSKRKKKKGLKKIVPF